MEKENIELMDNPRTIPVRLRFTAQHYEILAKASSLDMSEHRWFVIFGDNIIHCCRSWTGFEVFRAELKPDGDSFVITEILAEGNTQKYSCTDEKEIVKSFTQVIAWLVLQVKESDIQDSKEKI